MPQRAVHPQGESLPLLLNGKNVVESFKSVIVCHTSKSKRGRGMSKMKPGSEAGALTNERQIVFFQMYIKRIY